MAMEMEFRIKEHHIKMRELDHQSAQAAQAHTFKMEELKVTAAENEKKRAEAKRKAATTKKKSA
jgi:hypothetical protein